jgi:hypothetical protein
MAEKLISVGRIVVGAVDKDKERQVIEPGTEFDPEEAGLSAEEVGRLLDSGALRRQPEDPEKAPADGPREPTAPATNQPAPGETASESEVISRAPPPDESA